MKILEMLMLLCQYTYYLMCESNRRLGWSHRSAITRALVLLGLTETLVLATISLLIYRVIHGQRFHNLPFPLFPAIAAFAYGLVLFYINKRIIGGESRVRHYKAMFDAWNEGKHLRWKIMLISIAVLSLAAFFVTGEVTQNGPDPENWKY
jgi:hypothetical protein